MVAGPWFALCPGAMAKNLEEMRVYQHSTRAADAISALLKLPGFRNQFKLAGQLGDASDSVSSNIAEGFGRSNAQFVKFLDYARGSANEVRAHLGTAYGRGCITLDTYQRMNRRYEVIGKMLTRLIQYLRGPNEPPTNNQTTNN